MGDIVKRGKGYTLRWREGGRRRVMASRQATYAEARRMLQAIEGRVARGLAGLDEPKEQLPNLTVAELCERFLTEYAHPRIKDMERYRRSIRYSLTPTLGLVGKKQVAQLERRDIEGLKSALMRRYKSGTACTHLQPLVTVLRWAVEQELLVKNPAHGVKLPSKTNRVEYLSQEDAKALLQEAERQARSGGAKEWSLWVAVAPGLYAGLRHGEILGLRWQDVDVGMRRLTVAKSFDRLPKSGKPRHLPLAAELMRLLCEWRPSCPVTAEGVVCPILHKGIWRAAQDSFRNMNALYAAAGIKAPDAPWHALRHTFASHFLMSGGSLLAVSRLLGHADIRTTQIYAHLAPEFLADELDRLKF